MPDYLLENMDRKPRRGRPSAIYRTILVDFLAGPMASSRVEVPGKNSLAVSEGLRAAMKTSLLFRPISVARIGEDVFLGKEEDFWEKRRPSARPQEPASS